MAPGFLNRGMDLLEAFRSVSPSLIAAAETARLPVSPPHQGPRHRTAPAGATARPNSQRTRKKLSRR